MARPVVYSASIYGSRGLSLLDPALEFVNFSDRKCAELVLYIKPFSPTHFQHVLYVDVPFPRKRVYSFLVLLPSDTRCN